MSTLSWVTYSELAAARRIGRASAIRLARRNRWQRCEMGDGSNLVQALVPKEMLVPPDVPVGDVVLRQEMALLRSEAAALKDRVPAR